MKEYGGGERVVGGGVRAWVRRGDGGQVRLEGCEGRALVRTRTLGPASWMENPTDPEVLTDAYLKHLL